MVRLQAALVVGASAWDFPSRDKLQPFVDACQGQNGLEECSTKLEGTCASENGQQYCSPKHHEGRHHSHMDKFRQVGDCGGKADGEACSFEHGGFCVNSGKCPIFNGEVVCKSKMFLTPMCEGKAEGDACQKPFGHGTGTCATANNGELVCLSESAAKKQAAKEPVPEPQAMPPAELPPMAFGHHGGPPPPFGRHGGPPPEKFQPLIDACDGQDADSQCSATLPGTCKADDNGSLYCAHGCKGGRHSESKDATKEVADCGSKNEGDACSLQKEGTCVSSGKCPIFHGEMVCKLKDAHPPSFITDPCKQKAEGDACDSHHGPGTCRKFFEDMVCRPDHAPDHEHHEHHREHHEHHEHERDHEHRDEHEHHRHDDEHHKHGHDGDDDGERYHEHHHGHHGEHHEHHRGDNKEKSLAFTSGQASIKAPSSWASEIMQWTSGVPTWWSQDGQPHWTGISV